MTFPNELNNP